ncbi:TetR/AcrR family transcriptional regulator [Streptomyces sioyaensis]|uniref:TetR/AcrR family transcriptional regulator n=1 Tax=Streptomyces sioyaensis TaxID=67364 RepID=A0A4Q1R8U8_9ACTN|nr:MULTISPECIES: TetR/AcrR family transcriptional regulator [Streptomyces]MBM4790623.1 TetR/AcrR family transcriptional regulator [Streptomyces sioyaensis]RXS69790.1 TetR/AcrR family transcriptional regulator [Streptomyces sp. TM32]RXS69793.1 TetR/AcrR family transcriptional regulator [Streptomyces sioyaensis]
MAVDREQVLKEAAALLTRRATTSMDEIARAAGISRATLHRHFAGRDALIKALEEQGIAQFGQAMDSARLDEGDAAGALRRLITETEPVADMLAFLATENQLFEGDEVNAGWDRLDARITALFRRGQEEGDFRIDLSPAWLAEALYGLIGAGAWAVHEGRVARNDLHHSIAELLLGGIRRSMEK